jgi:hypothetical protein
VEDVVVEAGLTTTDHLLEYFKENSTFKTALEIQSKRLRWFGMLALTELVDLQDSVEEGLTSLA